MRKCLIFLFFLTSMGCFSQFTKLTVSFSPSFLDYSNVVIVKENSGYVLTISNNSIQETCQLDEASIADFNRFMVDYNQKKVTEDSIENARLREMWARGEHMISVDGIGVSIFIVEKKGTTTFSASNPKKGSIDQAFMRNLFKLMNATFKKPETAYYVEELESYFSLGMGLKKLNETPLTYKIYGLFSMEELTSFFNQLPMDKEVVLDLSHIEKGMEPLFYESCNALYERNPKVRWINCSEKTRKQLFLFGVSESSIR